MKIRAGVLAAALVVLPAWVAAAPTEHPSRTVKLVIEERAAEAEARRHDKRASQVTVSLGPEATVVGRSISNVETFNGIPYADAPVGSLRMKPPQKLSRSLGTFDATGLAAACPQMLLSTTNSNFLLDVIGDLTNTPFLMKATGQSEDCLTISVQRPAGTTSADKLPVLFWIFGGGFELGWSSMYDATLLVNSGVDKDLPFVYVAVNYRVAGWGFMPGKEIQAEGSGNAGLLDQRMGLEWVADNIAKFGGDPDKVTIWGESAGAISVFSQMALYGGNITYKDKALFRGAIMNSGSMIPVDPLNSDKGQAVYDQVVAQAGCSGSTDSLACLRALDLDAFTAAANSVPGVLSYSSVALSYLPRPDGVVLPESTDVLARTGRYAAVPMIVGDQEDEGTLFALFQGNISTTKQVEEYLAKYFFHGASSSQIQKLVATYPEQIIDGSPFRTGILNIIYPQFKRLAALLGDLTFTLTRRIFLKFTVAVNPSVPSWSYLSSYDYGTPIMGTFHASDLLQVFFGILPNYASNSIQTYYFNFVTNLDPNVGSTKYPNWPKWADAQKLVQMNSQNSGYLEDNFRQDTYEFLIANIDSLHL